MKKFSTPCTYSHFERNLNTIARRCSRLVEICTRVHRLINRLVIKCLITVIFVVAGYGSPLANRSSKTEITIFTSLLIAVRVNSGFQRRLTFSTVFDLCSKFASVRCRSVYRYHRTCRGSFSRMVGEILTIRSQRSANFFVRCE